MSNAPPSADPADDSDLVGVMRTALLKFLQKVDDCLPCRVIAVSADRNKPRVTVLPLVQMLTTAGETVPRAQVASVPVMQFGGGGFLLSFNIQPGNLGWLKASDRDISLFLQNYAAGPPNTLRLHSFEDAVFIPDVMTGYSIAGEDAENCVLQSLDGTVKISLGAGGIKQTVGGTTFTQTEAGFDFDGAPVTINGIVFDTHRHPINSGSSAPGPTDGPVP